MGRHAASAAVEMVAVAVVFVAACAPAGERTWEAARLQPLYVLSGLGAHLALLDGMSGRPLARPLGVGSAPRLVVADPSGALLVASDSGLEVFDGAAAQTGGASPVARRDASPDLAGLGRPLPLGDGARTRLVAGDGDGRAVVAYDPVAPSGGAARCRLAVVDLRQGDVARTLELCAAEEAVTGLAAARTSSGSVAYAALWRPAQAASPAVGTAGGGDGGTGRRAGARLVAVDVATGALVGVAALGGQPRPVHAGGSLQVAPGPVRDGVAGGSGRGKDTRGPLAGGRTGNAGNAEGAGRAAHWLYAVESLPGPVWATWDEEEYAWAYRLSQSWRLTAFAPDRLVVEFSVALDFAPSGLAVAPDGAHAYAFDALDDRLMEVDMVTGRIRQLARVPGSGAVPAGLAASGERVYAAVPRHDSVWAFDRRTGRRVLTLAVGRFPVALIAASPIPAAGRRPRRRPRYVGRAGGVRATVTGRLPPVAVTRPAVPFTQLVALAERGLSVRAIGRLVGRSGQAVQQRLATVGLSTAALPFAPIALPVACAACGAALPRATRRPGTRHWCPRPECQRAAARTRVAGARDRRAPHAACAHCGVPLRRRLTGDAQDARVAQDAQDAQDARPSFCAARACANARRRWLTAHDPAFRQRLAATWQRYAAKRRLRAGERMTS